jgi:hypothetical protein
MAELQSNRQPERRSLGFRQSHNPLRASIGHQRLRVLLWFQQLIIVYQSIKWVADSP